MAFELLFILVFLILIFLGVPIAFSFGISALFFLLMHLPAEREIILVTRTFGSIDSFALMAIPFFIFAGDIMRIGGVSRSLVNLVNVFTKPIKGGLAHVVVIASTFFGAVSGSAAATVAAVGGIMIPEMQKYGYDTRFACTISAASGFIGILIPPSVPLIVYGIIAEVSVLRLFLGGIIPGAMIAISFMLVNWLMVDKYFNGISSEDLQEDELRESEFKKGLNAIPALIMPLIILGGIYAGIFTPSEAGAVAVVYGIIIALFFYKEVNLKAIINIGSQSAKTSGVILLIIGLAGVFGWIATREGIPSLFAGFVTSITEDPLLVLLLLSIVYIILGTILETVTAIVITTPIFLPLIHTIGIDLVHFGVFQTLCLAIGLITPPMALNLLIACQTGEIDISKTAKPIIPYFLVSIVILLLVLFFPQTVLFLPDLLM